MGILPGTRKKDEGQRPRVGCVLQLLSNELASLSQYGVDVLDAHTNTVINVRAVLLTTGADYRGLEDMLRLTGAPRVRHGCYKCWTEGSKGIHKFIYPGAWTWLEGDDPLRRPASRLNAIENSTGQQKARLPSEVRPTLRTKTELSALATVG